MSDGASATLALAVELVGRRSVTPDDAGCQALLAARLEPLGFTCESLPFGPVANLWGRRGSAAPLFVFAGHSDVVPPGPEQAWQSPPFRPQVRDGLLYGRGAADMKGSIAAFVTACERFVGAHPGHRGSIGVLITSDEEGDAVDGTARVVDTLAARGVAIDCCLVGEPSSAERLGDTVRNGRRGSLNGRLRLRGRQGHVAYGHLARNPIHDFAAALGALLAERWEPAGSDAGFPPTSFQVSNVQAGTGATNVIPGELEALFNFRYPPSITHDALQKRVAGLLGGLGAEFELEWTHSGSPFITAPGPFIDVVQAALTEITGAPAALDTGGGTSDARFIAPTGAQVVELGPVNASIHRVDEHVSVADLERLSAIYERILERLLA
ncbi:MAG: succinyl-diaminopimelate desuccinylase [Gammaproteobacteria bacterium]|nr:succinyl-diaminopimelate desuccinylase [Gammaproteobacteria bacterium]